MRSFSHFLVQVTLLLSTLLLDTCYGSSSATPPTPISHVQVTLKGKKYDIENVTTLSELQQQIEEKSGIPTTQQGRILFQGKSLSKNTSATTSLSQAGVSNGDMLNCVPATSSSSSSGSGTKKKKSTTSSAASTSTAATTPATKPDPNASSMKDMMEAAGVDTKAMEDMVNSMMGGGGSSGDGESPKMPSMEESMQMMSDMVKSPLFTQYMNDPEKLEQSRQMILNNPMLKTMMTSSMPGMEELLNDKDAWATAMKAAADMYSNMDSNDLMNAMMQGADARMSGDGMASGMGGSGSGLFDGMMNNGNTAGTTPTALDELSEGED